MLHGCPALHLFTGVILENARRLMSRLDLLPGSFSCFGGSDLLGPLTSCLAAHCRPAASAPVSLIIPPPPLLTPLLPPWSSAARWCVASPSPGTQRPSVSLVLGCWT
ncbi:hypothetical protein AAFF_G00167530 [Aldrovandia affinis]|uniref:Uncharacterized protein n=1 Tax=Aldrovandia affinis TaxID=143900 RepID=A0AAD7VW78_9TELE|nr:hypothetical protein AAFF_G00167530 [Aldrovandia affinis]